MKSKKTYPKLTEEQKEKLLENLKKQCEENPDYGELPHLEELY